MKYDDELGKKAMSLWNADYSPLDVMIQSAGSVGYVQKEWVFPKKCWFTRKHDFYTHVNFNNIGHTQPVHKCSFCGFEKDLSSEEMREFAEEYPDV